MIISLEMKFVDPAFAPGVKHLRQAALCQIDTQVSSLRSQLGRSPYVLKQACSVLETGK